LPVTAVLAALRATATSLDEAGRVTTSNSTPLQQGIQSDCGPRRPVAAAGRGVAASRRS